LTLSAVICPIILLNYSSVNFIPYMVSYCWRTRAGFDFIMLSMPSNSDEPILLIMSIWLLMSWLFMLPRPWAGI
jgi:hypothetical protein